MLRMVDHAPLPSHILVPKARYTSARRHEDENSEGVVGYLLAHHALREGKRRVSAGERAHMSLSVAWSYNPRARYYCPPKQYEEMDMTTSMARG